MCNMLSSLVIAEKYLVEWKVTAAGQVQKSQGHTLTPTQGFVGFGPEAVSLSDTPYLYCCLLSPICRP